MARPRISVVIPTHNGWKTLKKAVQSLQDQSLKPFEIIVVDNASTDGSYRKAQTLGVVMVRSDKNLGAAGGRNKGLEVASPASDYIFFFDHDMVADKLMLAELVKVARMDQAIGIVTPKIYYWSDKTRIWSAGTTINLVTGKIAFRCGKDCGQYDLAEEVQVAPAAIFVKRKVLKKIGGFDDVYFATYEDTDFCFKARKIGFLTYYAPKAIAYHDTPLNFKAESERLLTRTYWVARNRVIFLKRYGHPLSLVIAPLYAVYYLALAVKFNKLSSFGNFMKGLLVGYLT